MYTVYVRGIAPLFAGNMFDTNKQLSYLMELK